MDKRARKKFAKKNGAKTYKGSRRKIAESIVNGYFDARKKYTLHKQFKSFEELRKEIEKEAHKKQDALNRQFLEGNEYLMRKPKEEFIFKKPIITSNKVRYASKINMKEGKMVDE